MQESTSSCPLCKGTGYWQSSITQPVTGGHRCTFCNGTGWIIKPKPRPVETTPTIGPMSVTYTVTLPRIEPVGQDNLEKMVYLLEKMAIDYFQRHEMLSAEEPYPLTFEDVSSALWLAQELRQPGTGGGGSGK